MFDQRSILEDNSQIKRMLISQRDRGSNRTFEQNDAEKPKDTNKYNFRKAVRMLRWNNISERF